MKRIFIIIFLILTVSCNKKEELKYYDFNRIIELDYSFLCEHSDFVMFYEAQGVLSKQLNEDGEFGVIMVRTIFRVDSSTVIITHPEGGLMTDETIIENIDELWIGDCVIPVDTNINLMEALDIIMLRDFELPKSDLFVLRLPIKDIDLENSQYIFGNKESGFIRVDSNTGHVELIDNFIGPETPFFSN